MASFGLQTDTEVDFKVDYCNGKQETHGSKINKNIVTEHIHKNENEGDSLQEKNTDFYEIIQTEIHSILEDPLSHSKKFNPISKAFSHSSIENLLESFGYNKPILKLLSWILLLNGKEITDETLNDLYWECMYYRLDKHGGKVVAELLTDIDKVEKTMATTLKEASKRCLTCCICKKDPVTILYLPCGHLILCARCFSSDVKNCQACRSPIDEAHCIFM